MQRRYITGLTAVAAALFVLLAGKAPAADPAGATDAAGIMKAAHLNLYYMGDDGIAKVHMELTDKKGKSRSREFIM
ncbi:MAG: hypothetical protein ABIH26_13470, partial [Candidatus Eisenbacteria bacterium]